MSTTESDWPPTGDTLLLRARQAAGFLRDSTSGPDDLFNLDVFVAGLLDALVDSSSLAAWVTKHGPRLVVTGHIHEARGTYRIGQTTVINASHVDGAYRPAHPPIVADLDATETTQYKELHR